MLNELEQNFGNIQLTFVSIKYQATHLKSLLSSHTLYPESISIAKREFSTLRSQYRTLCRRQLVLKTSERDSKHFNITKDNSALKSIKKLRSTSSIKISELRVKDEIYCNENLFRPA